MEWNQANIACKKLGDGWHTTVANDEAEQRYLLELVGDSLHGLWLGCHDMYTEGNWTCLDGSGMFYLVNSSSQIGYWSKYVDFIYYS